MLHGKENLVSDCKDDETRVLYEKIPINQNLENSEEDDEQFHPELLGLLDEPGVVRLEFVDYPKAIHSSFCSVDSKNVTTNVNIVLKHNDNDNNKTITMY